VAQPAAVNFGGVMVHVSTEYPLTLVNCSNFNIEVTPSAITGAQSSLFTINWALGSPFTVPAQMSVGAVVNYAPLSASSSDNATLVLEESDGGTLNIPLQGKGL
jgi:hypothetical protein